jgi:hypothetical protein
MFGFYQEIPKIEAKLKQVHSLCVAKFSSSEPFHAVPGFEVDNDNCTGISSSI